MQNQKTFPTRTWVCFALANALLLALFFMYVFSPQFDTLHMVDSRIQQQQRLLHILEANYRQYDNNQARLYALQAYETPLRAYLQPTGEAGAALEALRRLAASHHLQEVNFDAQLRGVHYQQISQMDGSLVAKGHYTQMLAFLNDVSIHARYFRLRRIQFIDADNDNLRADTARLWLEFSLYFID